MPVEVKVPSVGESIKEGMIGTWRKASGDLVQRDEVLLDLETDKASVEIVAEVSGKLEILAKVGQVVKIGEVIANIDPSASMPAQTPTAAKESNAASTAKEADNGPAVRRMAAETGIDPNTLEGSGKDQRVTKGDMIHAQEKAATSPQTSKASPAQSSSAQSAPKGKNEPSAPVELPKLSGSAREDSRKPMSMMRRRIAERLVQSQNTAAILTTFNELDMTAVTELRKRYADKFQEKYNIKLGFMGFFIKAAVDALQTYPEINAFIDGNDVIYHNYCDFSVAVSTEKGLLTPVIRDCDKMSIAGIELAIAAMAKKARDNKISIDDLTGGTFTISNGGIFGSLMSTPIINPPQTAILGMHKTMLRPIVMPDGKIEARPMMYLALSYDHRMVDGKEAVQFLVRIKENLEDPARLLLGV
ncbi:MAG: 2-oxoglutarate dehydrogenase complex dihydrolipoyllysine-residue succinyltransferase [Pseudomonadota bacterium]